MRRIFLLPLVIFVLGSFANAESIECTLDAESTVEVKLEISNEVLQVQIKDPSDFLEIRELDLIKNVELVALERKKESQYKFAKYYAELNAWQDLTISIPKNLTRDTFKGFLTIYQDTGNRMEPYPSQRMSCSR